MRSAKARITFTHTIAIIVINNLSPLPYYTETKGVKILVNY